MADWLSSMQQTFKYFIVDPNTWKDKERIDNVVSCTISRDLEADTLGSATIDITESVGECYIRAYLITIQNGVKERHPLGTFLVQTPSSSFNGKIRNVSMDTYTPLLELTEDQPDLGYYVPKKENIMDFAYRLVRERVRAPVVKTSCIETLFYDFVANTDDTWLTFTKDLVGNAKYRFDLDEMGRILFAPEQDTASLQPIWTYNDDNSSILLPDLTMDRDLYKIPNVVEVICSNGADTYYAKVVNDDSNSPISIQNRGRIIKHRDTNPSITGNPTQGKVQEYAENLLREMSALEYTITYTHGYCPVRIGDCVRLNYTRAGLTNVKAKVINQIIKCVPGCPVTETAIFTNKLWG